MISATGHAIAGGHRLPPLPEALFLVLAPFAPRFSPRVWGHAHVLLWGAMLAPGPRTVTAALRSLGWALARRVTTSHWVLHRATCSGRPGSRMLLGLLLTVLAPQGATIVRGADDTGERRAGRQSTATGGSRDAVRSPKTPVLRCLGLPWVSRRRLGPGPWSPRVGALPFLTARGWPPHKRRTRRPTTSVEGVRQRMKQGRRGRPGRRFVWGGAGGFAAGALALACGKRPVPRVSRWRGAAARSHPPGPPPQGQRGPQPTQGQRQRRWQGGAERRETPGEPGAVPWSSGQRTKLWGFSRPARW
jgi:hypothetical protein